MTKLEKLLTELELLEKNRRENGFLKSKDRKLYINAIAIALPQLLKVIRIQQDALSEIYDEPNQIGLRADVLAEEVKAWELAREAIDRCNEILEEV